MNAVDTFNLLLGAKVTIALGAVQNNDQWCGNIWYSFAVLLSACDYSVTGDVGLIPSRLAASAQYSNMQSNLIKSAILIFMNKMELQSDKRHKT